MESGDQANKHLHEMLRRYKEEFEAYYLKAKRYFDAMKQDLKENHVREIDELNQKYEQTIGELQKNASSDKENVQIEFKGQILTLEKKIEEIKKEHDNEKEKQMQQLRTTVKQFED